MSVQTEITRIESAKTAIATAIEGKGVTVPDGTLLDGMAPLIEAIEAGGGSGGGIPADHMGYPVATGEITFATDITSSYKIEFAEGNRLRIKVKDSYLNRPFFILTESSGDAQPTTQIKYIVSPTYAHRLVTPTVYALINAYYTDSSSFNSTYMKFASLTWGATPDSVNSIDGSDRTFTDVTIPCNSNIRFVAGRKYRYVVGAPWGYDIDTVEVV